MKPRENIWNLPNLLTMLRLLLIGVFIWLFARGALIGAMAVFLLAAITDFLDGFIARKYGLITSFGKLMDPVADKLMLLTALTCLMLAGLMPLWVLIVVAVKEVLMIIGGAILLRRGVVVQAHFIGKLSTVVFIVAVVASFLHAYTAPWDTVLQVVAVTLTVVAMLWYLLHAIQNYRTQPG